jgi:para-aminobenzoate synthetase component 1
MSKSEESQKLMNDFGGRRIPFFFMIDFDVNEAVVLPVAQTEKNDILYDLNGFANCARVPVPERPLMFKKNPVPFSEYRRAFDLVRENLNRGNSYLLNLTFQTGIETNLSLDEIFHLSRAKYRVLFRDRFVVFSPEIFVQVRDGIISSNPMKGTIDSSIADAEAMILDDPKELAEHTTIVDLIRNDLNSVAKHVRVEQFRYIDRIRTNEKELLQVSSRITGQLPADYHKNIGTMLFNLLPAGSVTGAPKKKTVEIIRAVETYSRGFYTGVVGYFDGSTLDSGVMIRFIEQTHDGLVYKSGGGITVFSNVDAEYQELIDKVYVPVV